MWKILIDVAQRNAEFRPRTTVTDSSFQRVSESYSYHRLESEREGKKKAVIYTLFGGVGEPRMPGERSREQQISLALNLFLTVVRALCLSLFLSALGEIRERHPLQTKGTLFYL